MTKPMKVTVIIIAMIVICCMVVGLFVLSKKIVDSSYNSAILIETVPQSSMEFSNHIVYNEVDSDYSTTKCLYLSDDLEERQKTYLSTEYDRWVDILDIATARYKYKLEGISSAGLVLEDDELFIDAVSTESVNAAERMSLSDGLELIGMCDNTTLMFAYKRAYSEKQTLIVVDASEMLFPTYRTEFYSFGEPFSVLLRQGCFSIDETDNYVILYVKG